MNITSTRKQVLNKIGALTNFAKFTGKCLYNSLFSIKLPVYILQLYSKRESGEKCFPKNFGNVTLHKKLRISSVNVTKSAVSCRFGHSY